MKMKTVIKNFLIILVLMCAVAGTSHAQKFGYVNSAAILEGLADVKQADSNLESLQKVLQKKYQTAVEDFQQKVAAFQQAVQNGEKSPLQQEQEGQKLKEEELEITKQRQDMAQQLEAKRQELLAPIYEKVNKAIKEVSEENGYQFIFEQGVLLYADEAQNITELVKAKLGS